MTYEEALQNITEIFIVSCLTAENKEKAIAYNEALQIAHKSIEAQMPKKPRQSPFDKTLYTCPACRKKIRRNTRWRKSVGAYCDKCGQSIDWSEYNGV